MSRKALPAAFEVEVPLQHDVPIVLEEHARVLAFAVVTRDSLQGLDSEWDSPGVYVLLGRIGQGSVNGMPIGPDDWKAYVGQATNLRSRLREHSRKKDFWATAVLVRRYGGRALNRAHIAWLEHALHERLTELTGVYLENSNTPPTDQGLSLSDERMAEEIAESTLQALSLIGYRGAAQENKELTHRVLGENARSRWESRAGRENLEAGEDILKSAAKLLGLPVALGFRANYIALLVGAQCDLRILLRPQRVGILCEYKIPLNRETSAQIQSSGVETLPYVDRWQQYRIRVRKENIRQHKSLLDYLALTAWESSAQIAEKTSNAIEQPNSRLTKEKQQPAIKILREAGTVPDGTKFYLKPGTLSLATRTAVEAWAAELPARGAAIWHNTTTPLKWEVDGKDYTPTTLAALILKEATGATTAINGAKWWVDDSGQDISALASKVVGR